MGLPTGTVTFLFTDIEGSTRLWDHHPDAMRVALARHDALLRAAIEAHDGHVFKTVGDAFCAAFHTPSDALQTAIDAQLALLVEVWPEPVSIKVRMALHTGTTEERDGDYFGPTLNRVARLLALGHGGQTLLSLTCQELVVSTLPQVVTLRDLGTHRLKDLTHPEQVFQLLHPTLPSEFRPLNSPDSLPNNLPLHLTTFIGREKEMAEVKSLLPKGRLLTLTGAGGSGKTRLSIQVAADLLDQFPDGVWLVEFAPIADPAHVPQAVLSVLNLKEQAGQTHVQTLTEYLKSKTMLLVLDNCEHMISAGAQLCSALLRACPNVKILASSREGLGIPGEQTCRVPSLSLPPLPPTSQAPGAQGMTAEGVMLYESVQLFVDRAQLARQDFVVTDQNAFALASICRRLDGIPLAIELAAARMRSLTVEEINTRLYARFRLLTGGNRLALPRQQTLRALIDWSYDLLSPQERTLFTRLSVFAGGWTLEAAEQICGFGSSILDFGLPSDERPIQNPKPQIQNEDVLDLLTGLFDKSLVVADIRDDTTRYRFLETICEYSLDRLQEGGELPAIRNRHRDCYLALAEEIRPGLIGPEQARWLAVLEEEHDNFRKALDCCLDDPEGGVLGLRLGGALQQFWFTRGHLNEGRQRFGALLAHAGAQDRTAARADALIGEAGLAWLQGDYASAQRLNEECLSIRRELGDRRGSALAMNNLGIILYVQGDHTGSQAFYQQSLAIYRELGDRSGISRALSTLGIVALYQGDYASACALHEESLAFQRELGDRRGIAGALHNAGIAAEKLADYASARARFTESLAILQELDDRITIAYSLESFASLALQEQDLARAVRLWGAAARLRETLGSPLPANEREKRESEMDAVRAARGDVAFDAAWAEGDGMSCEQAADYALGRNASSGRGYDTD